MEEANTRAVFYTLRVFVVSTTDYPCRNIPKGDWIYRDLVSEQHHLERNPGQEHKTIYLAVGGASALRQLGRISECSRNGFSKDGYVESGRFPSVDELELKWSIRRISNKSPSEPRPLLRLQYD